MAETRPCDKGLLAMQKKLQALDFSIVDVGLYLDAYPDSASALEYYGKLVAERERLAAQICAAGAPIIAREGAVTGKWKWTDGPWPWQA